MNKVTTDLQFRHICKLVESGSKYGFTDFKDDGNPQRFLLDTFKVLSSIGVLTENFNEFIIKEISQRDRDLSKMRARLGG